MSDTKTPTGFRYFVSFGGGVGPDVWDAEREIYAVDIHDALSQAQNLVEESGGWIFQVSQEDFAPTRDRLETELAETRKERDSVYQTNAKQAAKINEIQGYRDVFYQRLATAFGLDPTDEENPSIVELISQTLRDRDAALDALEKAARDWSEDDSEIKRLAESVGIQGDSKDDYFRSSVAVVEDLVKELASLRAQLEAAKADTKRLDWLERQSVVVRTPLRHGSSPNFTSAPELESEISDLRAAIDQTQTNE